MSLIRKTYIPSGGWGVGRGAWGEGGGEGGRGGIWFRANLYLTGTNLVLFRRWQGSDRYIASVRDNFLCILVIIERCCQTSWRIDRWTDEKREADGGQRRRKDVSRTNDGNKRRSRWKKNHYGSKIRDAVSRFLLSSSLLPFHFFSFSQRENRSPRTNIWIFQTRKSLTNSWACLRPSFKT